HVLHPETLQQQPIGVPGEVFIEGICLTKGYLGKPHLTKRCFIQHPLFPGQRLYRTGDYGFWRRDGQLAYLGRKDDQVKVHGYRIELGEIETTLRSLEGVEDAVVVSLVEEDDRRPVAYVKHKSSHSRDWISTVKKGLGLALPQYMIPKQIIAVPEWPLTPNGKIDKKALSTRASAHVQIQGESPRSKQETHLLSIFRKRLNRPRIGVTDDFFESGGHSLSAMSLLTTLQIDEPDLSIKDIFDHPTVRALSTFLQHRKKSPEMPYFVPFSEKGSRIPLILIPPIITAGSPAVYTDLVQGLKKTRPVYCFHYLQQPSYLERMSDFESLTNFVVEKVSQLTQGSPVILAGWSTGGAVAVWAAEKLQRRSPKSPHFLAVIDSLLDGISDHSNMSRVYAEYAVMSELYMRWGHQFEPDIKDHNWITKTVKSLDTVKGGIRDWERQDLLTRYPYIEKLCGIYSSFLFPNHQLKIKSDNRFYFRAEQQNPFVQAGKFSKYEKALQTASGKQESNFNIIPVSGNHYSCISRQHVSRITDVLNAL
ncbi:MAG: thioesterase domain-containing protein, partial [Candidatus Marinamargulisbacteria bacterium]